MSYKKYPVSIPELSGNEKKYLNDALDTNWISSTGKYVDSFENNFSEYLNINHTITVSNGTVALHLALVALGVQKDDEVIVSNHNGVYGPFAIEYVGAKPIFIESKKDTWNIDPSLIHDSVPVGDMNLNYTNAFDPNMQTSTNNLSNLASLSQTTNISSSNLIQQGGVSNNEQLEKLGMSDFSGFDLIQ